ncbi:hypothetical protein [Thermoflexibacter ruber]|uniref:Uncharacterized protein n=1 Tax=Thermoflexibacter ruber TaxID=1003 RepID=A0A1I2AY27_9BACT|nr:hypothetical protein [Thermoflexibacter ruber]SFE48864.1 hypothetical protein SAMN04488541_100260 [Thermoflexibacter ruber]
MKKLKMYATSVRVLTAICLLLLSGFGCEKDSEPFPVDFEYRLLNSKGEVTTTFKQGEDITFSFVIINRDPTLNALYNFKPEILHNGFCKVYKIVEGKESYIGMAACLEEASVTLEGGYPIGAVRYPYEIKYNWLYAGDYCENPNKSLPKGQYRTGFTQTFYESRGKRMVDSKHTTKTFEIYFEVK